MEICVNGNFQPSAQPAINIANRGFRYGDGIFETMLYRNGQLRLKDLHMKRLFEGMDLLGYESSLTEKFLLDKISSLCERNGCIELARVRLTVYAGEGSIADPVKEPGYMIEALPLEQELTAFNAMGLQIGLFTGAAKSCDHLSNLKSTSAIIYSMAARFAKDQNRDDALVLNTNGKIADSSIANIFIVNKNEIITPPLSDGPVNGVMRKFLIENLPGWISKGGRELKERSFGVEELLLADEVFLTNAIRGVRWVEKFRDKIYVKQAISEISSRLLQTIND